MDFFQHELLRWLALIALCFILLLRGWERQCRRLAPALAVLDFLMNHPEIFYLYPSHPLNFLGRAALVLLNSFWETILERYCPQLLFLINHICSSPERKAFIYLFFTLTLFVILLRHLVNSVYHSKRTRYLLKEIADNSRYYINNLITYAKCTVCPVLCAGPECWEVVRYNSFHNEGARRHMSRLSATTLAANGFYYDDNIVLCWRCQGHLLRRSQSEDPLRDSHGENCPHHPSNIVSGSGNYRQSCGSGRDQDLPLQRPSSSGSASNAHETTGSTSQPNTDTTGASSTSASSIAVRPQPPADDEDNQAVGGDWGSSDIDVNTPKPRRPQQP